MEHSVERTLSNAGAPAAREEVLLAPTRKDVPDGGKNAWIQVAGAFTLLFNSWGIVNTFGVYQTYYETTLLRESPPSAISWIGSIQSFLLLGFGLIAGPLFDAGYFTSLICAGTFAITFGFMMTSIATQYWQLLLAQGFCIGLGAGCLVVPGLALLAQYFDKRRALATGLAVSGGSLGGVVFPLVFQGLVSNIGFGWTNRVLGFMSLTTCSFAVAVMRLRDKPRKVRSLLDPKALREVPFICFCIAFWFSNLGFFIPIFYIQTYAMSHGLTDENIALHLVAILNAASIVGRLTPSIFVVRFGALNTLVGVGIVVTTVTFSWLAVQNGPANIVFSILFGFASGGIVSMPPVVLASITDDLSFFGARLGMSNFCNAIASLIGPPLAGAILKSMGQYTGVQLFAGFTMVIFTIFGTGCRLARGGLRPHIKV